MIDGLSIIIVNWNLAPDTCAAIHSLMRAGAAPEQIILVDNGSTDDSLARLRREFQDRLQIIALDHNAGFTGANNRGAAAAFEAGAEWVLLLNNDTLVPEDFFAQFQSARSGEYDLLSPVIFYAGQPQTVWHMGARQIPGLPLARNLAKNRPLPDGLPALLPVDFISGCAMFIRRAVYAEIGLFDPTFFAYWEEIDLCIRARQAGFHIATMTRTTMLHKVSLTADRDPPLKQYLYLRNMIWYARKNSRGLQKLPMGVYLGLRFLFTLMRALMTNQPELIQPTLRAWKDGWGERALCS